LLNRGSGSSENVASIYSTASGGARAAYLLLQESGYHTSSWEQPLTDLGHGAGKLLILADPAGYPTKEEKEHLRQFLESGGRVLAAGRFSGFYLPRNDAEIEPGPGVAWEKVEAIGLSPVTRAAPAITLARTGYWNIRNSGVPLYGDTEKPVVIEYKIGSGDVLWLASPTPITNAGVKESGNLEFLLAAIGPPARGEVLWDEYVHGYQRSARSQASHRVLGWIALQLAVLAGAVLLAFSRRSSPVWVPAAEVRLSPLEFVRTLGALYDHARAGSVALEIYYQRFRYLLTRRLGLPVSSSVDDLDRAVRQRWALADGKLGETLRECESLRYDPSIPPKTALRLIQSLFDLAERMKLVTSPREETRTWKRS
jgi:hypothetical protein